RVEVIRILAGQIVRYAAMVASPFSLNADSWLRIHTTVSICRVTHRSLCWHHSCAYEALENRYSYWDEAGHRRVMQVFVGCLDPNVTTEHIKQVFSHYGQLGHVKISSCNWCSLFGWQRAM
nr:polyadenylate-binding protein RBP45B [Tanacetum cinerariifolium]GEZ89582.1 polyadenylate-binding protein RBP45B [Tanacetum cinerariifolium]